MICAEAGATAALAGLRGCVIARPCGCCRSASEAGKGVLSFFFVFWCVDLVFRPGVFRWGPTRAGGREPRRNSYP